MGHKEIHDIVCISTIDWDFIWQGHQEIMSTLARQGHRVLFIENTGVRRVSWKDLPRVKNRVLNWRRGTRGIRQEMENLYIYSPLILPFPYSRAARFVNKYLMLFTLLSWARTMQFHSPVVWTWLPTGLAIDLIKALHGKLTVYYCFDNFEAIAPGTRHIRRTESVLIREADLVFVTARNLYNYCLQYNPNVHLVPSGFSKEVFSAGVFSEPAELAGIKRPIVGYVGGIHKLVDLELIEKVARAHPHISLVFVGPLQTDVSRLKGYPNVHFIGQKRHRDLPGYISHFDACIIPYVLNDYTKNVYPTKLNEYLILGKPVICTRIPELQEFDLAHPGVVSVAASHEDFTAQLELALKGDNPEARDKRIRVAEGNSWTQKIETMTGLIDAKLEEKKKNRELSWRLNLVAFYQSARRRAAIITASLLLGYGLMFYTPFVWLLGAPLKHMDSLSRADAIVVLAGGIGESGVPGEEYQEKVKYAVELYKQGYSERFIFSSGVSYIFKEAEVMKALAVSLGIPEASIVLDERGGGNYSSLLNVKRIMSQYRWSRMLLVTSRYNGLRSYLVTQKQLPDVEVHLTTASESAFFGDGRRVEWKHWHTILHEYAGILYYRCRGWV